MEEKLKKPWYENSWRCVGIGAIFVTSLLVLQWIINIEFAKGDTHGAVAANLITSLLSSVVGGGIAGYASFKAVEKTLDGQKNLAISEAKRQETEKIQEITWEIYPLITNYLKMLKLSKIEIENYAISNKITIKVIKEIIESNNFDTERKIQELDKFMEIKKEALAHSMAMITLSSTIPASKIARMKYLGKEVIREVIEILKFPLQQRHTNKYWICRYERSLDIVSKLECYENLSFGPLVASEKNIDILKDVVSKMDKFIEEN